MTKDFAISVSLCILLVKKRKEKPNPYSLETYKDLDGLGCESM